MQRKGNVIMHGSQASHQVTVGVDMGGTLWATAVRDWASGRQSYFGLRDGDSGNKKDKLYAKITELVNAGKKVQVYYEAGRYGFTPARIMQGIGAQVTILPVNKLQVLVSGKKVKTDRCDAKFLAGIHPSDNPPSVHIPTLEEEGHRDGERELTRLNKEIKRLNNQLLAIIERTPLPTPTGHRNSDNWRRQILDWNRTGRLTQLPKLMIQRLQLLVDELAFFEKHLQQWEKIMAAHLAKERAAAEKQNHHLIVDQLLQFKGIGTVISRHFAWEIGDWQRFPNGKKFAAYFGLTPCPYASGTMNHDQGISKAGRCSLRKTAVEMAWLWRRWQPDSYLCQKYQAKLEMKGRTRNTAIVAMARQLLVALWQYVVNNKEIQGAVMTRPLPIK